MQKKLKQQYKTLDKKTGLNKLHEKLYKEKILTNQLNLRKTILFIALILTSTFFIAYVANPNTMSTLLGTISLIATIISLANYIIKNKEFQNHLNP